MDKEDTQQYDINDNCAISIFVLLITNIYETLQLYLCVLIVLSDDDADDAIVDDMILVLLETA